jgi:hypothetical protein
MAKAGSDSIKAITVPKHCLRDDLLVISLPP